MAPRARGEGKTPLQNIRMEKSLWHAFGHVCADEGTDRTSDLRAYVERRVKAYIRKGGVIPPMPEE